MTALIQSINQKKRNMSPGSAKERFRPKNLKLNVYAERFRSSFPIAPIWERSITEKTITKQANI